MKKDIGNPEGLTQAQEKLAGMLFDTKTIAPVRRRITLPDNTFKFEKVERPTSPIDFAQPGEFALKLHETDPSARLSPIYINLRNLPQTILDQVGVVMSEIPADGKPDVITGIPKAGTPLAQAYSEHTGIPVVHVFDKEETAESRKIVAGEADTSLGSNLRIVDDLATHGDTKIEAAEAAKKMGYTILDLVVLVDRQQGATEQLRNAGYILRSALTLDQLLKFGLRTGRISKQKYDEVVEYLENS